VCRLQNSKLWKVQKLSRHANLWRHGHVQAEMHGAKLQQSSHAVVRHVQVERERAVSLSCLGSMVHTRVLKKTSRPLSFNKVSQRFLLILVNIYCINYYLFCFCSFCISCSRFVIIIKNASSLKNLKMLYPYYYC